MRVEDAVYTWFQQDHRVQPKPNLKPNRSPEFDPWIPRSKQYSKGKLILTLTFQQHNGLKPNKKDSIVYGFTLSTHAPAPSCIRAYIVNTRAPPVV